MKKLTKRIFILVIFLLFLQFITNLFTVSHDIEYKIKLENNTYVVHEIFRFDHKKHIYGLKITNKSKQNYLFQASNNYHKDKKIVLDIIELKREDVSCMYPILRDNVSSYPSCIVDNQQISYDVLRSRYKDIAIEFDRKLKDHHITLYHDDHESSSYQDMDYYPKNIGDKVVTIWNYHELLYFTDKKQKSISLFKNDQYENKYSINDFDEFFVIDLKKGKKKTWKLKQKISLDCYFLGVVDDIAYLFDKDNLVEYAIDIGKRKIKVVGNKEKNGQYYDGKWRERNIYDFKKSDLFFIESKVDKRIIQKYPNASFYDGNYVSYFVCDHNLYFYYKAFPTDYILLLEDIPMREVTLLDDDVYFIDGDTLYWYDKNLGLKKLVTSREMEFNFYHAYTISNQ